MTRHMLMLRYDDLQNLERILDGLRQVDSRDDVAQLYDIVKAKYDYATRLRRPNPKTGDIVLLDDDCEYTVRTVYPDGRMALYGTDGRLYDTRRIVRLDPK